jgi:hypothetical protein
MTPEAVDTIYCHALAIGSLLGFLLGCLCTAAAGCKK